MRGIGKTKELVMSLPETGCVVVVHNPDMKRYISQMIYDLRGKEVLDNTKIRTVSRRGDEGYLYGLNVPIFVDHAFYETGNRELIAIVTRLVDDCNSRLTMMSR